MSERHTERHTELHTEVPAAEHRVASTADSTSREAFRARVRGELRARALAHRHGIASPGGQPAMRWAGSHAPDDHRRMARSPWPRDAVSFDHQIDHQIDHELVGYAPWYDAWPVAAGAGLDGGTTECEQWVRVPHEVMHAPGYALMPTRAARVQDDGSQQAPYLALTVRGESMLPLLADGDLILVRRSVVARVGRVVVAWHDGHGYDAGAVVKAVTAVRGGRVALASLAPGYPTFEVPDDERHVLGTVVARWARDGWGPMER